MSIQIIDSLQIVEITYHYRERFPGSVLDLVVNLLLPLRVGMLVFNACQGINRCHSSGCLKMVLRMCRQLPERIGQDTNLIVLAVFQHKLIISPVCLLRRFRQIAQRLRQAV